MQRVDLLRSLPPLPKWAAGRLAQLAEHLVYTQRVGGSSPSPPTNYIKGLGGKALQNDTSKSKAGQRFGQQRCNFALGQKKLG
jgi:hypothetical protein